VRLVGAVGVNAPLVLSFLHRVFVADNVRSISATELASRLDDELYALNQRDGERGGRRFPKPAKAYLDDWAAPEVTFDNAGVGGSTGTTPDTVTQMAHDAIAFLTAMEFDQVDMLGFSIGSFVAQETALIRPGILNRLVLASSAPQGAAGMHGWAPEVIGAVGGPQTSPEQYLSVFFAASPPSRQAGTQALQRMYARTEDRDQATTT